MVNNYLTESLVALGFTRHSQWYCLVSQPDLFGTFGNLNDRMTEVLLCMLRHHPAACVLLPMIPPVNRIFGFPLVFTMFRLLRIHWFFQCLDDRETGHKRFLGCLCCAAFLDLPFHLSGQSGD